jgi:predicted DNA-binding transcriptional regulator YafY
VSAARTRLAALAAAAGYPSPLLTQIAHATLPAYQPGDTLSDAQIEQLALAIETLAHAGHDAAAAAALIARHQQAGGQRWRDGLWREVLRAANARCAPPPPAGARPPSR